MSTITIDKDPRSADQLIADEIRQELTRRRILTLNLISSPGSGKTTLLEKALPLLADDLRLAVIEADNATTNDADRLQDVNIRVVPVCTGVTSCHLSAAAARKAIGELSLEGLQLLVIENVGNLVCPAEEDIGEDAKVAVVSIAEGEDKPLKYPLLFHEADLVLINKVDAAEALGADVSLMEANVRATNPKVEVMRISARTGEGLDGFLEWVRKRVRKKGLE